jgi:hypothetical protein
VVVWNGLIVKQCFKVKAIFAHYRMTEGGNNLEASSL